MDIKVRLLETREQAVALAQCVYRAHGLTHHRHWLYEPDRVLAYNQAGHVRSFVAEVAGRCVAHAAAITPSFELQKDGRPVRGERVRELGLVIIDPTMNENAVRARLVSMVYGWAMEQGLEGLIVRCRTDRTDEQRLVRAMGAVPTAVHLASTPEPVGAYEGPVSVVSMYLPLNPARPATVYLPRADRDLYGAIYANLGEARDFRNPQSPALAATSEVRVEFDSARQVGNVHVLRAGPDLEERVLERAEWLLGGRIRHVSISVPLSSPYTPDALTGWKGHGLCFAGVLPGYAADGDALILQGIRDVDLLPSRMRILDPLACELRDRALSDWELSRDLRRPKRWLEAS